MKDRYLELSHHLVEVCSTSIHSISMVPNIFLYTTIYCVAIETKNCSTVSTTPHVVRANMYKDLNCRNSEVNYFRQPHNIIKKVVNLLTHSVTGNITIQCIV